MIQQSTAPVAANWLPTPSKSSDHGPGIRVAAGVISFFKALHPDYALGSIQMELPTLCADPPEKGCHSTLQRTELAARVACACVGLPATVVSCIGGAANFSAVVRWLCSNLIALEADNVANRDDQNPSQTRKKQRHRACHQSARLPKTAIGLGATSCLGMVGAVPTAGQEHWIIVDDSSVLEKIGHDPAYPLDGQYRQLADVDASNLSGPIGNTSHPFVGKYDGRCQSIDQLRHCFVQKLDGNGRIDNVRFARANISSSEKVGVVACELSGSATLSNIVVEHSTVGSHGSGAPAGIGAGVANNKTLINGFRTFNCTTKTSQNFSAAGAVAGVAHGTIENTRLDSARVETLHVGSDAGGGAGVVHGLINNTMMIHSNVITHGMHAHVGGGAGVVKPNATVANTLLVRSNLSTNGLVADVGGGGGMVFGAVINTTMAEGRIEGSGEWVSAAVGAGSVEGSGKLVNTTGQRVVVTTSQWGSYAAVGAGFSSGDIEGVVCFDSQVAATGEVSKAALGVSRLAGRAVGIVACQCSVRTYGPSSFTGLGFIDISNRGDLRNLTVIYGRADALGRWPSEDVNGGVSPFFCNASVGDKYESPPCCNNATEKFCLPVPEDACKLADRRVLTSDCRPVVPLDAEKGYDFVCPALPTLAAPVAAMSTAALAGGIAVGVVVLGLAGFALYRHYHQKKWNGGGNVSLIDSEGL